MPAVAATSQDFSKSNMLSRSKRTTSRGLTEGRRLCRLRSWLPAVACASRCIDCRARVSSSGFSRCRRRQSACEALPHGYEALAALRGICFDRACQEEMDKALLFAISLPIALAVVVLLIFPRRGKNEEQEVFSDRESGVVFEAPPGVVPERDRAGELVFRAESYTPWPVEAGAEGERVRIDVGPIKARHKRTFIFDRVLRQPSKVLAVTMPRPLGVVFEEDAQRQRVIVSDLIPGSVAEQRAKVAKLSERERDRAVQLGDILRACTCTNFVYPTRALFGAEAPTRTIVVFGATGQKWTQVAGALRKGDRADGEVTLVLERPLRKETAAPL